MTRNVPEPDSPAVPPEDRTDEERAGDVVDADIDAAEAEDAEDEELRRQQRRGSAVVGAVTLVVLVVLAVTGVLIVASHSDDPPLSPGTSQQAP